MDTTTERTFSKGTPAYNTSEDSVMIIAEYRNGILINADNTYMQDTSLASHNKQSATMLGKDSNTIDTCNDSSGMPVMSSATRINSSITVKTENSNLVESVSPDCPLNASGTVFASSGGDPQTTDRGTKRVWEPEITLTCPANDSEMTLEAESKHIKTEQPQFFNFHPRVVNLTDIIFSADEESVLNKYLKFNIEPEFEEKLALELISVANIAADAGNLEKLEVCRVQYKLGKAIRIQKQKSGLLNQKSRTYKSAIESISKKLSEGKAVARKADEGDFIVIVKEAEYIDKTLSYFDENCIAEISDITDEFQAEINKYLRQNSLFGYTNKKKYEVEYCTAPELIPLLRVHGTDFSIRPFVNMENSPADKLTVLLNKFLTKNYIFRDHYTVYDSMDVANQIKREPITCSSRLACLGIRNLYSNVPVDETIGIIENNLFKNRKVLNQNINNINEFIRLLKLVVKFNYFSFNTKFYNQKSGLVLGSSLSDTMADIFINSLEEKVLKSDSLLKDKIVYYRRSVDKILLLVDGTEDEIDNICNTFNRLHAKIDFYVEHESNNRIQFLDLEITRLKNQLTFNVFRKPTTTDVVIHNDSCHPQTDKEAAFRSLLHRAYNLPLSEADRLKELNIIKQIAHNNGYSKDMVNQLMGEEGRNKEMEQDKERRKIVRAPYYGEISEKMVNIFESYNVKFLFQAKNLVKYNLRLDIENRKSILEQAGVYKLKCSSCNVIYIGKTRRTFLARYKEHITCDRQSAVAKHMKDTGHRLTGIENDLEVLHVEEERINRDLLEKFEITLHKHRFGNDLLNKQRRGNRFFDVFVELFLY